MKHGHFGTPTHNSWSHLKRKKFNSVLCDRWLNFVSFLEDMGEKPDGKSLRRIDPSGKYEKANCEWANRRAERSSNYKHGMRRSSTYKQWCHLVQGTTNPRAHNYKTLGALGIKLCTRWLSFEKFFEDMGERPDGLSLRRIDDSLPFSKENCRWVKLSGEQHFNYRHGKTKSATYATWASMMRRTRDPNTANYHRYGGRGITVCPKWATFDGFYEDMGEKPEGLTIERIDNDEGYFPGNCKWATRTEQARNRQRAAWVVVGKTTIRLFELAELTGLNTSTIRYANKRGYLEKLISERTRKDA